MPGKTAVAGTAVNETVAATEKIAKAKQLLLGLIDPGWLSVLAHPMVIFVLVFAVAILFLARTGLWNPSVRQAALEPAIPSPSAPAPERLVARMPAAPPTQSVAAMGEEPLSIVSMGAIEAMMARQHEETALRADRALAISEEALRLHAAALDELAKMNDALNRLVAQVDGATAGPEVA